jgi:2-iminobutanoate/2-iminopropanoate deaminase
LVFVSGQASVDDDGAIVVDDFEGEMRRSIANLRRVLSGAGLDLRNVAQVRAYVDNAEDLPRYNEIYREFFSDPLPARTTLIGCLGGTLKFEIDAIAIDAP